MLFILQDYMSSLGIEAERTSHPIEAESRSITTYVHPPLFLNSFSLQEIFSLTRSSKYMYKLYPEGPITPDAIRSMVRLWKEISSILVKFGAEPVIIVAVFVIVGSAIVFSGAKVKKENIIDALKQENI